MDLLDHRPAGATICPSELARALVGDADADAPEADWRASMPMIHAAIDVLVDEGLVRLSWKGTPLPARSGPYRIAKAQA